MKKLIALLLSIAIVLSVVTIPSNASSYSDILGIDESKYDMALFYEHLWENYNHDMHGLLWEAVCEPQYYVYPQVVEEVGSDGWIEFASNITEEQLSKERYIGILSNLLVMIDYNTKDLITEQVNADSTKKLKDYVVDVTGILVQTVSLDAAFGSHVTKSMEKIATAMDLTWGFADFTIDTIEIYESLDRTLRQYEIHREFLSAIAQNTTNATLKDAALELGEATDKVFFCKVNTVADTASGLACYLGKDVFFDTIVLEYMATDASVLGISEDDVAVLGVLKSAYEYMGTLQLAADIGVFAGDAIIGISDVMNRYNEMRALTDIRNALIQQMTSYRDSIQNVGDAEKIGKLCSLMKNLIYVNFRGEYCAHEMSTHDAQLYSLIIKINGQAETSDRVYEQAKENTEMYSLFVDMIFPELEFYRFEDDTYADEHSKENDHKNLTQINSYKEGTIQTETHLYYNDNKQIIQIDSSTLGEYSPNSQTVLTYDDQGRLISIISGNPDIPGMNSGSEYTYNNQGQVVRVFSWEGGAGETLFEYDNDGNRIRKTEKYDVGTYITEYSYDANGLLISSVTRCTESGGNSWTENTTYSYDSEHRLVQEIREGGYSNTSYIYDYSFENFVIEEYSIDDERSNVRVYYYSTFGNDTCVLHFLENPQFYADASGRLAKIVDTYTTKGEIESTVYEFFYDEEVALPLDTPTDTAVCYEPVVAHTYEEAEKLLYEYFGGIYGFDGLKVRQVSSQSKGTRFEMTISGEGGAPIYIIEWYKVDLDTGEVRDANSYKLICDLW